MSNAMRQEENQTKATLGGKMLTGQQAVVTGGTRGIGLGIARVLNKHGAKTAITGLNDVNPKPYEDEGLHFFQMDVSDGNSVRNTVSEIADTLGGLSIAVCNAGIFPQIAIEDQSDDDFDDIVNVNLRGTSNVVRAALPHLKSAPVASVIFTSSITGSYVGYPGWALYGATKAAQLGYMRSAALELAPHKITVNAVLPGNVLTESLADLGEEYLGQMSRSVPLGYLGSTEDIGEAVAFFGSNRSRYITGQDLILDGGQILPETQEALEMIQAE